MKHETDGPRDTQWQQGTWVPGPGESNEHYWPYADSKKKNLHHTASAFTKQSQRESVMGSRQCGKLMKSLIRVCEAAVGVTLTIAFS